MKKYASISTFGIIPIDTTDKFANLKPENKLLGLWTLELPVLFSDTPAYKRVAKQAGLESTCIASNKWSIALDSHTSLLTETSIKLASEYLSTFHSQEVLIEKWDAVIRDSVRDL